MRFMNDFDLVEAQRRFARSSTPNRLALALVVGHLADWTNTVSDGWAYWPKPCRAAARAIELIDGGTWAERQDQEENDVTDAEMLAAVRPIRSFLTRHSALLQPGDREVILRAVDEQRQNV